MATRRISFLFEGLKTFVEQIGTVLIIILTAYLVLIDYPGMTIGKIMYHVLLFSNVSAPIRQLHRIYDDLNDALIYAEGFFGILEADGEVEPTGSHRPVPTSGGGLTFCVPVTVCSVKRLVVIGYNASGTTLFTKTMTLANAQSIERNHMYPIPSIQIN